MLNSLRYENRFQYKSISYYFFFFFSSLFILTLRLYYILQYIYSNSCLFNLLEVTSKIWKCIPSLFCSTLSLSLYLCPFLLFHLPCYRVEGLWLDLKARAWRNAVTNRAFSWPEVRRLKTRSIETTALELVCHRFSISTHICVDNFTNKI